MDTNVDEKVAEMTWARKGRDVCGTENFQEAYSEKQNNQETGVLLLYM